MKMSIAVDTGGTFSDLIGIDGNGELAFAKTLTTPDDPSRGIFEAIRKAGIDARAIDYFVHGSTVATNMLIERSGGRVGLITTKGFRDVLRIQRIVRPDSFDLHWVKPRHLVERSLSLEVTERIGAHGEETEPLDEDGVRDAIATLKREGVRAIAVSYLFSFLNPSHERRTQELIEEIYPEAHISISSDVFPQWREYERTSTTVIDVYLKPRIDTYLTGLERQVERSGAGGLLIMRSNGGVMTTASAKRRPVTLIQSGPAGGVIASLEIGRLMGIDTIMTADVGGTSFDTCLISDSAPTTTSSTELEFGIPIANPMLDIRSIGAGGGSKAWIDSAGLLKVGPASAGADPGPACYGRGGSDPTSTDANVVLGRIDPAFKLGGDVEVLREPAADAVGRLGERLGFERERTAAGILEIMNNGMAEAMRLLTIDRGLDPREFTLVAFGGAGPLHAADLASLLGMRRVVVPIYPGVFSALGALLADARFDYVKSRITFSENIDPDVIGQDFAELEERAAADFEREGFADPPRIVRSVDFRYYGQNWELEVQIPGGEVTMQSIKESRRRFDAEHERQFGWNFPESDYELVNFRVTAVATRSTVELPELESGRLPQPARMGNAYFHDAGGYVATPIYRRGELLAGNEIEGPAIVVEDDATTLVPPEWTARVEGYGNMIMELA